EMSDEIRRCAPDAGPLGEAFAPPRIVLRDRMELRKIECNQPDVGHERLIWKHESLYACRTHRNRRRQFALTECGRRAYCNEPHHPLPAEGLSARTIDGALLQSIGRSGKSSGPVTAVRSRFASKRRSH